MSLRTHHCASLNVSHVNQTVVLCGWISYRRDHSQVTFVDLRDRSGYIQVVFDHANMAPLSDHLRHESVLRITGSVRLRPEGMRNSKLPTGEIEIVAKAFEVLNRSAALPFIPEQAKQASEEVRLSYRYLDLRHPAALERFKLRAHMYRIIRQLLDAEGFIEMETPILCKPTPEGAREYLVPSRVHPGHGFALAQSPQLFKQLLMLSGFERYYQIARCFRDEDLRADRQPEFTQLDLEMSFIEESDVLSLMERLLRALFNQLLGVALPDPFPRLSYQAALDRYGTDKPDLRITLKLTELTHLVKETTFKVFQTAVDLPDGRVAALRIPAGANLTRRVVDDYTKQAMVLGIGGLAYLKVNDMKHMPEGIQSPILKHLSAELVHQILLATKAQDGDLILLAAGKRSVVDAALGALRVHIGQTLGFIRSGWFPLWIIDWPMFEEKDGQLHPLHHPFTAPLLTDIDALYTEPLQLKSRAYDLVLNGCECGGGSIRIHQHELQKAVLSVLGLETTDINEGLGFFLEGLRYGCPPHGGIALGLDRLCMLMTQADSIRDIIAFPKTQSATCLLTRAPGKMTAADLNELGLKLKDGA